MELHFAETTLQIIIAFVLHVCKANDNQVSAFLNGDFIVGALLPIHYAPSVSNKIAGQIIKCGAIREDYGVQRVETAFQTIDKINADPNLLPNITLGIEIRDECWYAPVALQQSIELIRDAFNPYDNEDVCFNATKISREQRGPLVGVVGPGASSVALQVQNLLQLFHIPQIGYSTTSKDLSDKSRFNYFLRVVPSDFYQAQVILDIVRDQGWTYVSTVNTNDNYGQAGIQVFRELAEQSDVCIAREFSLLSNDKDEVFEKAIKTLDQDKQAVVVVCFCEGLTVRGLLDATRRLNMTNRFLFIGSDGWADRSDVTQGNEMVAWGSISIRIHSPIVKDFASYYLRLKPYTNTRDPWFREMWEDFFHCSLDTEVIGNGTVHGNCTGDERFPDNHHQDAKLSFVVKAILSLAHGLHNMHKDLCPGSSGVCSKLQPFNGSLFKSYLMNVSFEYENDTVQFDENGDPPGKYVILNYQKISNNTYDYVEVGNWHNGTLTLNKEIQFGNKSEVISVCSVACHPGYYKNIQQSGKEKKCCWACSKCESGQILHPTDDTKCEKCPNGTAPNENQTECVKLPVVYTKWYDAEAIISIVFSIIGVISTVFSFVVFLKHNDTPVVKSSTRELSYIILMGMVLTYLSVYAILAKPSRISCALERILPGVSFSLVYAALLTKTNRIARILAGSKKKFPSRKRMFMSTKSQVALTCAFILIEILISAWMLYDESPNIQYSYEKTKTFLECNTSPKGVIIPLLYDFLLIFFCTLYALKTRNVPENFNEAKFIGFAMYTTCVIWVAFVPIYFGSNSKVITFCMCVTLSAMVTWAFLFIPKLYIIIFRPERNNRSFFTTSKTIRCHIGSRVASALTEKSSVNSWRESSATYKENSTEENGPEKRTLSCQTEVELLQVLLNPKMLLETYTGTPRLTPRITERNCCQGDNCELKNITITLPDRTH